MRRALAPPPKQTMSEWADSYRRLARANSAEPGQWRTSRVPFLRAIMDDMSDPDVEEVVFRKSAQVGYTDGVIGNTIGYYIDHEPSPMMIVQPTIDDAEKWSKEKLAPMLEETPRLRSKVSLIGRDSSNTILSKRFPGGTLRAVGTNSPRALRQSSARVILFDEIDAYPPSSGAEGDAITLGKKRAMTFGNRKYLEGSTPTMKGTSRIDALYEASDQRRYFVPCPHCGTFQTIEWRNVIWTPDLPETAHLACDSEQGGCGAVIEERDKVRIVQAGEWRAGFPGRRVHGYAISAFYSLFAGARWEYLVREFLDAKGSQAKLQVWTNTVLGESFEEDGERVEVAGLAANLEQFTLRPGSVSGTEYLVPLGAAVLTAAVDVQGDRLEYSVRGWGPARESWLVDTGIIPGDPGMDGVWREADRILWHDWLSETGATMKVSVLFVDTGGHHSAQAYAFTKARRNRNWYAIKGSSVETAPLLSRPTRNNSAKAILYMIGTHAAKDLIFSLLKVRPPPHTSPPTAAPGYQHLPDWLDTEHLEQLTSEKVITRYKLGRPTRAWVKVRDRNEQLDLFVYELAALSALRLSDAALEAEYSVLVERGKQRSEAEKSAMSALLVAPPARRGGFVQWKK